MNFRPLLALLTVLVAQRASAFAINADSDLVEWLAGAPTGTTSDWTPVSGHDIKWSVEDDTGRDTYLGPGWGGQAYDAEAIYAQRSADYIHIAVVTGRAPGAGGYVAGDIAIDFGLDGIFDLGLVTLGDGVGIGQAGELYAVNQWNYGLWTAPGTTGDPTTTEFGRAHPTSIAAGSLLGTGSVSFSYAALRYDGTSGLGIGEHGDAGRHYVIEAAIPLEWIDPGLRSQSFLVHWTMACANDFVEVDPPAAVPVPTPLALLAIGLLPLLRRKRRD